MVGCHATFVGSHAIRLPCRRLMRTRACERRPAPRSPVRMAGGVPKVPYKAPGAQNHEFIDIFNRLYRERIIYVGQDLDDESANQIIAVLLYLENDDAKANVSMYFNCPGGTIPAGLAVYDCMQAMKYPVVTLNLGLAASMSAFLVAAGTKGKRMALPNSRFLLQSPSLPDTVRGQASDVAIEVRNILNQRNRIIDGLHQFTGRSNDQLKKDLNRDMYLTAPEARTYGLIDNVLMPQVKGPSDNFIAGLGSPSRVSLN
ncbi:Endopeptidase Clp [Gracilaria domingensis]|nr:Endopeptidase Clp [Gracilaria domingensis]